MSYDSSNIKILNHEQQLSLDFVLSEQLATKYSRPKSFIERSVEACRLAGVDPREYFEERYLKGNTSIPENKDVTAISREIQNNMRI